MLRERSRPCCCRVLHLLVHQKQQHTAVLTCCTLKQPSLENDIGTQHTQERKHRLAPVSQARSTLSRQLSTNLTNSGTTRSQKPRQTMELGCFDMQCTPAPCHQTKSNHHRALNPRVQPTLANIALMRACRSAAPSASTASLVTAAACSKHACKQPPTYPHHHPSPPCSLHSTMHIHHTKHPQTCDIIPLGQHMKQAKPHACSHMRCCSFSRRCRHCSCCLPLPAVPFTRQQQPHQQLKTHRHSTATKTDDNKTTSPTVS